MCESEIGIEFELKQPIEKLIVNNININSVEVTVRYYESMDCVYEKFKDYKVDEYEMYYVNVDMYGSIDPFPVQSIDINKQELYIAVFTEKESDKDMLVVSPNKSDILRRKNGYVYTHNGNWMKKA